MNSTINIYETLNEREKYILNELGIKEKELKPENALNVVSIMKTMTERISELPLTNDQVLSAINEFGKFQNIYFKGVEFILSEEDYPDIKMNVYRKLSDETKKTMEILDIKVEDKEMTAKEYAKINQVLANKILVNFGTGIKKQECIDLKLKIILLFYIIDMANNKI